MIPDRVDTMSRSAALDRAKWFVFEHFERLLVILLVAAMAAIHWFVDYKVAFLAFYYLPVIVAGFQLGRRGAVWSAVLSVALVAFEQAVVGLYGHAGFEVETFLALVPWGGFLILTGYAVGTLADQRAARLTELKGAYVSMLELLTFALEASERHSAGHSYRVASRAVAIGRTLGMKDDEVEHLRVAALLHQIGPQDPRVLSLFERFPGSMRGLPVASSMRAALDIVRDYGRYHETVGPDFPVDMLRLSLAVKILAVADAYETLQMPAPSRPPFSPWAAMEEIERGSTTTFGSEVVQALRRVASAPDRQATPIRGVTLVA